MGARITTRPSTGADRWFQIETEVAGRLPKIDKLSRHAGEHFRVFNHALEFARPRQELGHVIGDFADAGLDVERRIPRPARGVEAVGLARLPIGEGSVDETRIRHTMEELVATDPFGSALLRQ